MFRLLIGDSLSILLTGVYSFLFQNLTHKTRSCVGFVAIKLPASTMGSIPARAVR